MLLKLILLFGIASGPAHLPWIEDNYSQALADAKTRHLPLFVEVWAPW